MANKNKYSNVDLSKYSSGYQESQRVKDARKKKQQSENAVDNYGDFKYSNQSAYQSVINDILNRKDFSYDMNADALYQQYKDQYTALGELAMQDTIGQASALTGGYGNSYAVSAGSQAYQSYLNQLNDKIPELWSLARSAYESDRAADYDKFGMLSSDRQTQYGEWNDGLNRLLNERGYYSDNYNNAYSQDYTKWNDNRSNDTNQYWNEYNAGYQTDRDRIADNQWQQQFNYQQERDKVADNQWQKQYDENVRQHNEQMAYNKEQATESSTRAVASEISGFNNRLLSEKDFKEQAEMITRGNRGNTGNGGFKLNGVTYSDYKDYVYKQLEMDYSNGLMSEATLNYLLDAFSF